MRHGRGTRSVRLRNKKLTQREFAVAAPVLSDRRQTLGTDARRAHTRVMRDDGSPEPWPRTPGLPGVFGSFQWVDSPDFGEHPGRRRVPHAYDVDPAPLARLIGVSLQLIDGDLSEAMTAIAADDQDGPIHLVHLLAACEYAARRPGGGLPGPGADLLTESVSGDGVPVLAAALRDGGLVAATAVARGMDHDLRYLILDSLLSYWRAPIDGLLIDITDEWVVR